MNDKRAGYPDIEKIDDERYQLLIPIPTDPGEERRGEVHHGGIIDLYLTGDQVNEWINRFSVVLSESDDRDRTLSKDVHRAVTALESINAHLESDAVASNQNEVLTQELLRLSERVNALADEAASRTAADESDSGGEDE